MIISRIQVEQRAIWREDFANRFADGYSLHQAIWDLFSDSPDRKRDFLYRLDYAGKLPVIHALSARRPSDADGIWHVESKDYEPQVKVGMRLGFTIRVNPTRKKEGKRHDVVMDEKLRMRKGDLSVIENRPTQEIVSDVCGEWIKERSGKNGFSLQQLRADGYRQERFSKVRSAVHIRYSTVDLTGVLQVTDVKPFVDMLCAGLGPEKGFGCGLMLVRKI